MQLANLFFSFLFCLYTTYYERFSASPYYCEDNNINYIKSVTSQGMTYNVFSLGLVADFYQNVCT